MRLTSLALLAAVACSSCATTHSSDPEDKIVCKLTAVVGCNEDVCIADSIISDFEVTYDLFRQRYSSAWGSGKIRQVWQLPDGRHGMIISSPPAGQELVFSSDWRTAKTLGDERQYTCNVIGNPRWLGSDEDGPAT